VESSFQSITLLDENFLFFNGFFNNTVPMLTQVAILRLDGDMYESTADVLLGDK
jgi:Macrocin-O-methyltransferase (TylF)